MCAAFHRAVDKAGIFQRLYMFGGAGEGHAERGGKFADAFFAVRERAQHGAPRGIGEGREDGIERALFNHEVEYRGAGELFNRFVE
jgi:hypothetical protein